MLTVATSGTIVDLGSVTVTKLMTVTGVADVTTVLRVERQLIRIEDDEDLGTEVVLDEDFLELIVWLDLEVTVVDNLTDEEVLLEEDLVDALFDLEELPEDNVAVLEVVLTTTTAEEDDLLLFELLEDDAEADFVGEEDEALRVETTLLEDDLGVVLEDEVTFLLDKVLLEDDLELGFRLARMQPHALFTERVLTFGTGESTRGL
jgi:hypothetical protein